MEVYVLGAGASCVHGAPLADELLPYALCAARPLPRLPVNASRLTTVRRFLKDVFHVDARLLRGPIKSREALRDRSRMLPSLVDALSVVDMALDRREALARSYGSDQLRQVREALEYAIYLALRHSLSQRSPFHQRSNATRLLAARLKENDVVLSLNYDVLIDSVLAGGDDYALDDNFVPIDYGLEFANVRQPVGRGPRLLKLHGSFNWIHSRVTGDLYYGGLQKKVGMFYRPQRRLDQRLGAFGGERLGDLEPILVTPTHLKDLRSFHLAALWRAAETALRQARRITFVGYSLPGDDLHIKYLFKRALETRRSTSHPRIVVVDHNSTGERSWTQASYENFFGAQNVAYHGEGFDAFAAAHLAARRPRSGRR